MADLFYFNPDVLRGLNHQTITAVLDSLWSLFNKCNSAIEILDKLELIKNPEIKEIDYEELIPLEDILMEEEAIEFNSEKDLNEAIPRYRATLDEFHRVCELLGREECYNSVDDVMEMRERTAVCLSLVVSSFTSIFWEVMLFFSAKDSLDSIEEVELPDGRKVTKNSKAELDADLEEWVEKNTHSLEDLVKTLQVMSVKYITPTELGIVVPDMLSKISSLLDEDDEDDVKENEEMLNYILPQDVAVLENGKKNRSSEYVLRLKKRSGIEVGTTEYSLLNMWLLSRLYYQNPTESEFLYSNEALITNRSEWCYLALRTGKLTSTVKKMLMMEDTELF